MRYSGVGTTSLLEAAVNIADQLGDTALQADALYRLGMVAYDRSESDIAQAHFEEAQPLYEQIGDLLGQANSIYGLGDIAVDHSDHDTARTRYEQALVLFHQVREPWSIG